MAMLTFSSVGQIEILHAVTQTSENSVDYVRSSFLPYPSSKEFRGCDDLIVSNTYQNNGKLQQNYKMKVVNRSRVIASSLGLLSFSSAVVEAFHSSPLDSRFHQRQNDSAATKLDAASLAISFEEDLALTRQIIMDHQERSATVSKEQFIQQMEDLVAKPTEAETLPSVTAEIIADEVDISVPYDAAAKLAYASFEGKQEISYDAFQTQYLADAVALVKSKQPKKQGDVSPPAVASIATTTEITIPETQSTVDDTNTKKKSFLQPAVSWLWKQVSRN